MYPTTQVVRSVAGHDVGIACEGSDHAEGVVVLEDVDEQHCCTRFWMKVNKRRRAERTEVGEKGPQAASVASLYLSQSQ